MEKIKDNKKIFFITGNLTYGGAPKILIGIANYLSDYYDVSIYNFGIDQKFYQFNSNIKVHTFPMKSNRNLFRKVISVLYRFFKVLFISIKHKPELLISFDNTEKLICVIVGWLLRIKTIISERKDPYNYNPKKKNNMYWRYNKASGCVFQTPGAQAYYSDIVKKKSIVIPNFIERKGIEIDDWDRRENVIAFVGRFDIPAKRPDIMVEAFNIVHKKHPQYKLVFYGGGSGIGEDINTIKKMVEQRGLQESVDFAGVVKPVLDYLSKAKIFALTSAYEGIPNVLLEAMSIGLPCVATDCSPGGARFLINNRTNGILSKINDAQDVANGILYLIENPFEAERMGKHAKQDIERFDPLVILPMWKEYIDRIITK